MSTIARSKSFSARANRDVHRPFAPALLKRARAIVSNYQIILRREEDGLYYGRALEPVASNGHGRTPGDCVRMTRESASIIVAIMLEEGQVPPSPAWGGARTEQLNIRLSAEEKLRLEDAARRQGFRGPADYVRAKVLASPDAK